MKSPPGNLRLAREADIPALEELIPLSVRALQSAHHSPAQMDAALGPIFGVDRQLIRDGTYFVVELDGRIIACGGWSRRKSLFGGDAHRTASEDEPLDPARDAARVRAFFVHPEFARRGLGRAILQASEAAVAAAGFRKIELSATLAGEPLYASLGYRVRSRSEIPMRDGLSLPVMGMEKSL